MTMNSKDPKDLIFFKIVLWIVFGSIVLFAGITFVSESKYFNPPCGSKRNNGSVVKCYYRT